MLAILAAVVSLGSAPHPMQSKTPPATPPIRLALMCFKTGEKVSGMNKICFYDCAGSEAAVTVGAAQLCPLSINR